MAEEITPYEDADLGDYIGTSSPVPESTPLPSESLSRHEDVVPYEDHDLADYIDTPQPTPTPPTTVDFSAKWTPTPAAAAPVAPTPTAEDDDSDLWQYLPSLGGDKVSDQTLSDQITGGHSLLRDAMAESPAPKSGRIDAQWFLDMLPKENNLVDRTIDTISGNTLAKKLGFAAGLALAPEATIPAGLANLGIQAGVRALEGEDILQPWEMAKDFVTPGLMNAGMRFGKGLYQGGKDAITKRLADAGMKRPVEMPIPEDFVPASRPPPLPPSSSSPPEWQKYPPASGSSAPLTRVPLQADQAAFDAVQEVKEAGSGLYPMARTAARYMANSANKHLRELAQRFAALDSTAGGLAESSKAQLKAILQEEGLTPQEIERGLFDYMKSQMQGHVGGPFPAPSTGISQNVMRAAQRIRDEIFEPFAQRMDAGGMMTKVKDPLTGIEALEPFKRVRNYVPEYSKETPFSIRALGRNLGRRQYAPWMHRKTGPVLEAETNALNWGSRYIDEASRKVGQLEALGASTVLDPDMPGGDYANWLITQAINDKNDPVGASLALKAMRDIYEPATMSPGWKKLLSIPGQILLGQNPLTQLAQPAINVARHGLGNTAEGMGRWISSPEFRKLHKTSGAMEPGWMQSVTEGFGVTPESLLGKGIKAVDQTWNRGITAAGVTPLIEETERAAMAGRWTPSMERLANEMGVTRQQLEQGLSQGQLQAAQAHMVQRGQLLPGGAGQRMSGLSEHPTAKGLLPWLDFQAAQAGMANEDFLKPLIQGNWSEFGLGAGRIARGVGTALALETALRPTADVLAGRGVPDKDTWAREVLGRTATDIFGAMGAPIESGLSMGSPSFDILGSSPAMSVTKDLLGPIEAKKFLDYVIAAHQALGGQNKYLQILPYMRNLYRNSVQNAKRGD